MNRKQLIKKISIGAIATCVAAIPFGILVINNSNKGKVVESNKAVVANSSYEYKPIELEYSSYNVPIVMNAYNKNSASLLGPNHVATVDQAGKNIGDVDWYTEVKTSVLPAGAGWWVGSALPTSGTKDYTNYVSSGDDTAQRHPFVPQNNKITFTDKTIGEITWEMPYYETSDKINNCLKLDSTHTSHTITFKKMNSYAHLYVLATAANTPAYQAKVTMQVNYSDGSTKQAYFNINDWFASDSLGTGVQVAVNNFTRIQVDKNKIKYGRTNLGSEYSPKYTYPNLYRCNVIDLDISKLVSSIDVSVESNSMVTTIYGICGAFANDIAIPNPTAINVKNKTATIKWDTVANAKGYKIDVYSKQTTNDGNETIVPVLNDVSVSEDKTSYDLGTTEANKLEPGTTYYYRMRSVNESGETTASSPDDRTFTTSNSMTVLDPTDIGTASFTANWTALTSTEQVDVNRYELDMSKNGGTSWETTTFTDFTKNSYTFTGLEQGTEYQYRIRYVYNDGTYPEWSEVKKATTLVGATAMSLTPKTVNLLTGGTQTVTSYVKGTETLPASNQNVTWSGQESVVSVTTDSSDPTKHTVTALKPGQVTLTAKSKDGSFEDTCTVTVNPNKPTITGFTTVKSNSFKVNFKEPTESKDSNYTYTLEVADNSTFTNPIYSESLNHVASGTQAIEITGLTETTTYYARVKTNYTGSYTSDWSSSSQTTPTITEGSITLTGTTTIDVSKTTDITSTILGSDGKTKALNQDIVWTSEFKDWDKYLSISTSGTTHTIKALKATPSKASITLKATAKNYSSLTQTINISINIPTPTAIAATGVYPGEFTANWNAVDGVDGYKLTVKKVGDKNIFYGDVSGTSKKLTGLLQGTKYSYTVEAISNEQFSAVSNEITVDTTKQASTGLSISSNNVELLVGQEKTVNSLVLGSTQGGTEYEAYDQTVTSTNVPAGKLNVVDNKKVHTISALAESEGNYTITLSHTSETAQVFTQQCNVAVKGIAAADPDDYGPYSFKANWESIAGVTYNVQLASDSSFEAGTIIKDQTVNSTNWYIFNDLEPNSTYYYRVRYLNNSVYSSWSDVKSYTLGPDVTGLSLDKDTLQLDINEEQNVTATVLSPVGAHDKTVEWKLDDESIAQVQEVVSNDNTKSVKVTGLKVGTTTLRATIVDHEEIEEKTCTITVGNPAFTAPDPKVKDITPTGVTIYWDGSQYKLSNGNAKFIVNIWYIDENKKLQIENVVINKVTEKCEIRFEHSEVDHLTSGRVYQFNVAVYMDGLYACSDTRYFAIPNPFPLAAVVLGATVGTLLVGGAIATPICLNKKAKDKKKSK